MPNIFKDNNKDTRTTSGASIVNFEHIFHFILLFIAVGWGKRVVRCVRPPPPFKVLCLFYILEKFEYFKLF